MHKPLAGIKVLEVAQFTFTPSAGAILAEWGAEVVKVEHAVSGDAQRGMLNMPSDGSFWPIMEHPNHGKRSIGLALDKPSAHDLLLELCSAADVFLINFLPDARQRLKLEVADIRAANRDIIYVRGSAHGQRGPWATKGGYDGSSFWCRMASGWALTRDTDPRPIGMPAGAFGDSLGGMAIAGGIAAALLGRQRTGEPSIVDVSLMSVGAWAMGLSLSNAAVTGEEQPPPAIDSAFIPTVGNHLTSDGRWINFTMPQFTRHFPDLCRHLGLEDLLTDDRFATAEGLVTNSKIAFEAIGKAIGSKPYSYWVEHLVTLEGPWAPVQSTLEVLGDVQVEANGYVRTVVDLTGKEQRLVANPVQFDELPPDLIRAPQFAEHTDEIVLGLGRNMEELLQLKIDGAIT